MYFTDRPPCNILVVSQRPYHYKEAQLTSNIISPQLFGPEKGTDISVVNPECPPKQKTQECQEEEEENEGQQQEQQEEQQESY